MLGADLVHGAVTHDDWSALIGFTAIATTDAAVVVGERIPFVHAPGITARLVLAVGAHAATAGEQRGQWASPVGVTVKAS